MVVDKTSVNNEPQNPITQLSVLSRVFLAMQSMAADPADIHFGVLLLADGPAPDLGDLRQYIRDQLPWLSWLTHRIRSTEDGGLRWEPDPCFDIDAHVTMLPSSPVLAGHAGMFLGGSTTVHGPLWRMVLLPGAGERGADSRWGIACLVHHAIADGTTLLHALDVLFGERSDPDPIPAPVRSRDWRQALRVVPSLLGTFRAAPPVTAMSKPRGTDRVFTQCAVALSDVRSIAAAADATVGQVHLAAVAGAIRRWSPADFIGPDAHGRDVPVCVPIDTRLPGEEAAPGNLFGLLRLPLPTGIDDRCQRLQATASRLSRSRTAGYRKGLRSIMGDLPPKYAGVAVRRVGNRRAVALAASIFRPIGPLRVLGAPITDIVAIPWLPPRANCFSILTTYRDRATWSVLIDGAADRSQDLAAYWGEEIGALRTAFDC